MEDMTEARLGVRIDDVRRLGDDLTGGSWPLTDWTAGAHVPAVQLSSLPLDEWYYMGNNEIVHVRLRPSTPTSGEPAAGARRRNRRARLPAPIGATVVPMPEPGLVAG